MYITHSTLVTSQPHQYPVVRDANIVVANTISFTATNVAFFSYFHIPRETNLSRDFLKHFGRRIAVHLADDGLHPINYMLLCALNYSFQQYYILFRSDCRRMMYATVIKTTVLVVETE